MRFGSALVALALALALAPGAGAQSLDFAGTLGLQTRWYPESPAFAGQRSHASGFVAEPNLYTESAGGASFTLTPFARYDSADSRRTHADLREAYLLVYGDWGANFWELRLGVGLVDFGLSAFAGTNREPFFVPAIQPGSIPDANTSLIPYYEQIRQFGLDAQLTVGSWLFKLEAIHRSGARNLLGEEEDYRAAILGGERTVYAVFGSVADLTLLAEWHDDGRGRWATNVWANDVFVAGHLALNDVQGTEIAAGLLGDLSRNYRALSVEMRRRRLSNRWSMRVELIANVDVDPEDLTYDARRDSFVAFDFNYNF